MKQSIELSMIYGIAIGTGILDFAIKGSPDYAHLPDLMKGYSWHILIAIFYILCIAGYSYSLNNWNALWGILVVLNEDLVYWVCHWLWFWELKFNPPVLHPIVYIIVLLVTNAALYLIVIQTNQNLYYKSLIKSVAKWRYKCPYCGEKEKITWNWVSNSATGTKIWYHECGQCDNVFETDYEVRCYK